MTAILTTSAPPAPAAGDRTRTARPVGLDRRAPEEPPGVRSPRLLLPPAEPRGLPTAEVALAAIAQLPVHSPVTDRPWPVARPAPAPELPDPGPLSGAVALAALEVVVGRRPAAQLARWVSPAVLDAVTARAVPPGRGSPSRSATVRRTLVTRVSATVAEAAVVLHDGARVRAAAVRLEVHRDRWRATVLQIG